MNNSLIVLVFWLLILAADPEDKHGFYSYKLLVFSIAVALLDLIDLMVEGL